MTESISPVGAVIATLCGLVVGSGYVIGRLRTISRLWVARSRSGGALLLILSFLARTFAAGGLLLLIALLWSRTALFWSLGGFVAALILMFPWELKRSRTVMTPRK